MLLSEYSRDLKHLTSEEILRLYIKAYSRKEDDRQFKYYLLSLENGGTKDNYSDYKEKNIRRANKELTKGEEEELTDLLDSLKNSKKQFKESNGTKEVRKIW